VFTGRDEFEARLAAGGFLEHTEFLGSYYGTPTPEPPPGRDVVLEIELHGARQVRALDPDALVVFVLPPSREEQERRLRGRGDPPERVAERLRKALEEEPIGIEMADVVVVNDALDQTVEEIAAFIGKARRH
jgi:guanylate kinase